MSISVGKLENQKVTGSTNICDIVFSLWDEKKKSGKILYKTGCIEFVAEKVANRFQNDQQQCQYSQHQSQYSWYQCQYCH